MQLLGVALALASAAVWGAGDFSGGLASRRTGQLQVLTLSALSGIVMLVVLAALRGEPLPSAQTAFWAGLAGLSGTVGLACLYRGLALGNTGMVAPTAADVTAALPVVFAWITEGRPHASQLSGFVVAMVGIWLVAATTTAIDVSRSGFRLALPAAAGFGGFLILIGQVPAGSVFGPAA